MKRYLITIFVISMALAVAWPVLGQREGKKDGQVLSEEEMQQLRARVPGRAASRGIVFGREEQLKTIEAIEEQLVKLKEAIKQAPDREDFRKLPEASPEQQAKLREEWQKKRQEQQQMVSDIQKQLTKLEGPRSPARIERPGLFLNELKAIRETAIKENAKKTVEHIESLIAKYQIGQEEQLIKLKKAPEFTLTSFGGKTISLSDYKGKIVVLEWFNLECPFVQYHYNTANTMVDLAKKYKDKVVWLAINSTSHTTPEENKTFAEKHKLPYPILDDRSGKVGRAYNATNTPHIFIIDTKGYIVYDGAIDNSPMGNTPQGQELINYVDKALTELKAGRTVSIRETKPYGCTVKYANQK
jgi:peroxiredoxin